MAINFNYNSNLKLSYIENIINNSKGLEDYNLIDGYVSTLSSNKIVYKEGSLTLTINGYGFTSDSGDITVTSINCKITNGESFSINCSIKGNIYYSDLTDVLSNVKATKLIYTIPYGIGKILTQTITADNLFTEYSTSDVKNFKYEISDGIGGNIIFSTPLLKASDYNNVINGDLTLKQQIEFFKSSSFLSGNDNISIVKSTELFLNKNGKPELNGYAGNDTLSGSKLSDILNGGSGADKLIGGLGNDTYYVDLTSDVVTELASQGTDTVISSASTYTLSSNVENLTLSGTSTINGTGNSLNNVITGNSANNVLNGGTGIDTVSYSNATKGVTVSLATIAQQDTIGAGKDTISNFENLTGSSYADTLSGNSANNVLNGGANADTMLGGAGNDTYYVDNSLDKVYETKTISSTSGDATGIDTVNSSVTYTISAYVENLTLTRTSAINGTGNTLNNTITGNSAANTLNGGLGNDILSGGAGKDIFVFNTKLGSTNVDKIKDFNVVDDTIHLKNLIFTKLTTTGTLNSLFFKANTDELAKDSNDYLVYETDTGKLFYDADGSGYGKSIQIALIENKVALTYADFMVI